MSIELQLSLTRGDFALDVALTIPERGVTAIFGPSGCGKTTLLRAIAGLEPEVQGTLQVSNSDWQRPGHFLPIHKRPLGYVFQEPSLFAHLSVQSNLEYGLKRRKGQPEKIALASAIELLGIGHLLQRKPHQLSGGEQQRVAIARALAVSPDILLMDEPLAALDQQRKQEILPYLESLHQTLDIPLLYVSHSRDEVARLADHMVLLSEGKVVATGSVSELFSRLDLNLAHEPETEALINATVAGHDAHYGLSYLDFAGGRFTVAGKPLPLGQSVRLQVQARDVSLTLSHQGQTSILNIFPATVEALAEAGPAHVTVRLLLGNVPLLSRITRKSAEELGLAPNTKVYAQIKSVALMT